MFDLPVSFSTQMSGTVATFGAVLIIRAGVGSFAASRMRHE
jgi:hypothetical protein